MARTCSSTRARSTAAGSAWAPSADTARPPRTVSRSSSRRSEGSSSTATSNNSEPIRGSPSTDPKGASSKPGSPGTHPTGAQVSTSSRSVNTPIAPGSHTHPTQSSPTPRTTPRCVVVMPSQPEPPGLPTRPLAEIGPLPHRDRSSSGSRSVHLRTETGSRHPTGTSAEPPSAPQHRLGFAWCAIHPAGARSAKEQGKHPPPPASPVEGLLIQRRPADNGFGGVPLLLRVRTRLPFVNSVQPYSRAYAVFLSLPHR